MEWNEDIGERIELAIGRLQNIVDDDWHILGETDEALKDYFDKVADFILYVYDVYACAGAVQDIEKLREINHRLYEDILGDNYESSWANPEYAVNKLGKERGQLLSFLYAELRGCIAYAYEEDMLSFVAVVELFLEVYGSFLEANRENTDVNLKYIREAVYYHMYDYADVFVSDRVKKTISCEDTFAYDIIMNSDLSGPDYLYKYGEYIGENEIKTAEYLSSLDEEKVRALAKTYVMGFVEGFKTMRIDLAPKKTVNIRYSIGQERMIRYAIELFEKYHLRPIINRYAVSRINRRLTIRTGYVGTPANKQYEYDHRMDEALFIDKALLERKLEVTENVYSMYRDAAMAYAGPAVIETFGELPFKPEIKAAAVRLTEKQQELAVKYSSKSAELTNRFIPRDKYSFTIIAYPIPEIGENFTEIFDETVKVNTLNNDVYREVQQKIILELDKASYVHVLGQNGNRTDIKVMLHDIDMTRETNFENCLADVNIPLGEVFTSPVLKGTNGVLNVSRVYLNELKYVNLYIEFEDGRIKSYTCDNFDDEEENRSFIRENLMFNHDTLPIGEFAIGTNTTAYAMANKYDILYKLPILIVEKMGPHFAVGDTCYSYSEEARLYNPDGREIVAKDNECSILRSSEDEKIREGAYFNCHTDITIPYEEIGGIYAVHSDGTRVAIIENGRFVLEGTDILNKPLDE